MRMINDALPILRSAFGPGATFGGEPEILAVHDTPTVIRVPVEGSTDVRSVIVKCARSWRPYDPGSNEGPATGLFAEWAGLEFVRKRLPREQSIPRIYGGDRATGMILIEDLGRGPTLEQVLCGASRPEAERVLADLAVILGRLHARAFGQGIMYARIRSRLGPLPRSADGVLERLASVMTVLGTDPPPEDIRLAVSRVQEAGAWAALTQREPGNGNVVVTDGHTRLIDFEASAWTHALLDAAFPRMCFGHLPSAGRLPAGVVDGFERAYREELRAWGTEPPDFEQALADACVYIAVDCLGAYFATALDESKAPFGGIAMRSKLRSQWSALTDMPVWTLPSAGVERFAASVLDQLRVVWGAEPDMPIYPVFTNGGV